MADSPIEKIHIDEFLTLVEGLEVYQSLRQDPPEPDFWAETNFGLIGIEHTRLFKKVDQNKIDPVLHEMESDEVLKLAKELFQKKSDACVHVSVSFRSDYGIRRELKNPLWLKKTMRQELAEKLMQFVLGNIPQAEQFFNFDNPNPWTGEYILPEIISSVGIFHYPKLSHSFFGGTGSHVSPTLENGSRLFDILKKKNRRPQNYERPYSEIWLVMVTSPFNLTMDFNFERSQLPPIESTFDRVFIYRHGDQKYHELPKITR